MEELIFANPINVFLHDFQHPLKRGGWRNQFGKESERFAGEAEGAGFLQPGEGQIAPGESWKPPRSAGG